MRLTKHHGLGNDFLVLLDPAGAAVVDGDLARALCDRRRGIGADGLLHGVGGDGSTLTMTLYNADGSQAEMSGNGIRCLAQAEAMRRGVATLELDVATAAGLRHVSVQPGDEALTVRARVDMGPVQPTDEKLGASTDPVPKQQLTLSVGNPHLVQLFEDVEARDQALANLGDWRPQFNHELVVAAELALDMRVVERGVGETLACGTGACAAAWAARVWGLAGDRVTVRMPGGDAEVLLGDTVTLVGPSTYVADIEAPWR